MTGWNKCKSYCYISTTNCNIIVTVGKPYWTSHKYDQIWSYLTNSLWAMCYYIPGHSHPVWPTGSEWLDGIHSHQIHYMINRRWVNKSYGGNLSEYYNPLYQAVSAPSVPLPYHILSCYRKWVTLHKQHLCPPDPTWHTGNQWKNVSHDFKTKLCDWQYCMWPTVCEWY